MKKNNLDTPEHRVKAAELQYQRMMENVKNGIIDHQEIGIAMTIINMAHQYAISQNERNFLL